MKQYVVSEISYSSGNKPIGVYSSIKKAKQALMDRFEEKLYDFDLGEHNMANCTFSFSCDVSEC